MKLDQNDLPEYQLYWIIIVDFFINSIFLAVSIRMPRSVHVRLYVVLNIVIVPIIKMKNCYTVTDAIHVFM